MSWDDLPTVFATTFLAEIGAVRERGEEGLRQRVAALPAVQSEMLREALAA